MGYKSKSGYRQKLSSITLTSPHRNKGVNYHQRFNTGIDPIHNLAMRGTVNMSPQGGAPTEPASKFNHSINTTGLPPKLNHTIDPSCFLQHGPHGPSDISAGHVAPTRLYWEQDSLASELSNKIKEWTLDMDAFVMERKLQGDTYALVAEKMKEKFGASVDLNLLQDRWETDIKKHLRDCVSLHLLVMKPNLLITAKDRQPSSRQCDSSYNSNRSGRNQKN